MGQEYALAPRVAVQWSSLCLARPGLVAYAFPHSLQEYLGLPELEVDVVLETLPVGDRGSSSDSEIVDTEEAGEISAEVSG